MKNFLLLMILSTYICAATINQKMIVAASKKSSKAEKILRTVKYIITKQKQFPQLDIQIEKLDVYFLVTISPIHSIPLRHRLVSLLDASFSGIFMIENIVLENEKQRRRESRLEKVKVEPKATATIVKSQTVIPKNIKNEKRFFLHDIANEWYALFALALAGIMLVMRSNSQIKRIKKLQMKIETMQEKNDE